MPFLPAELRLEIWRHALSERIRIIKLDVNLQAAVATFPAEDQKERIVFGGQFRPQGMRETTTLVWPWNSQSTTHALSLVNREARKIVLERFPDLIRIDESISVFQRYNEEAPAPETWRPGEKPRRLMLRCNMKEDNFYIRELKVDWHFFEHERTFMYIVYAYSHRRGNSPRKADQFRQWLKDITNLIIDRPGND